MIRGKNVEACPFCGTPLEHKERHALAFHECTNPRCATRWWFDGEAHEAWFWHHDDAASVARALADTSRKRRREWREG